MTSKTIMKDGDISKENEDIIFPDWIGKEISNDDKYFNYNLSKRPYQDWGLNR